MALSYNHNDSPRTIGCVPAKSSPSYDAALLETVIICFWNRPKDSSNLSGNRPRLLMISKGGF